MRYTVALSLALVGLIVLGPLAAPAGAQAQQKPTVQIPQPGVPQIMTLEGAYVRAAYNNEGYAILGYRLANQNVGQETMLLEFGVTVREGVKSLHVDARRPVDRNARRQDDSAHVHPRLPERGHAGSGKTGHGHQGLDQLLPAEREPGVPGRVLRRAGFPGAGLRPGRALFPARMPRPALLPGAGRDHSTASTGST